MVKSHFSNRLGVGVAGLLVVLISMPSMAAAQDGVVARADSPQLASLARGIAMGGGLSIQGLDLETRGKVDLEMERFRVFADDVVILAGGQPFEVPENVYFRGVVRGIQGSRAVLSFKAGGAIDGLIFDGGELWQVSEKVQLLGLAAQRLDILEENRDRPFECQTDTLGSGDSFSWLKTSPSPATGSVQQAQDYSYTARVAVDTDWEFLDKFGGNVSAATDYVGDLFAFSSTIYEDEVDTSLYIGYLKWWPGGNNGADPWTQSSCSAVLSEFRSYWNQNHGGTERTIAHFMSGKSTGCGIAYVGALCSSSYGYGVTGSLSGNFDPVDPLSGSGFWDIMAVSHEIGHNFGSHHTHCYSGVLGNPDPVDECYSGEGGCYSGPQSLPGCSSGGRCGTIMSYCHLRSGGYGNISLTFGQGHPYGVAPWRVPSVMNSHVVSRAQSYPACLATIIPGEIFLDGFESGDASAWD